MSNEEVPWIKAQKTTFENWVNQCLKKRGESISDIITGFKDSTKLYVLYQELTGDKIKLFQHNPVKNFHYINNLNLLIKNFQLKGVKLVNIQGEDIYDENLKLILGFTWTLILYFQILGSSNNDEKVSAKKIMVEFVNSRVPDQKIKNFTSDWKDGVVLAKLIDSVEPNCFPAEERPNDAEELVKKCLQMANEKMDVPEVIKPEFIIQAADENSLMTYISYIRTRYEENRKKVHAPFCRAYGPGLQDSTAADSPHHFTVELRNIYDEPCPTVLENDPLKNIDVRAQKPQENVQFNSKPKEPGFYDLSYEAVRPGKYVIDIRIPIDGEMVKDSPFELNIGGPKVTFSGPGLENTAFEAGQQLAIEIDSGTQSGGLFDERELSVAVSGPDGSELPVSVVDHENGRYTASYAPSHGGKHTVRAEAFGAEALRKEVDLSGGRKELTAVVEGEMKERQSLPDNRASGFTVRVQDEDGEKVDDAEVGVVVKDKSGESVGKVDIEKADDGSYKVNVDEIEKLGDYTVDVSLNGEVKDSFAVKCVVGADGAHSEGTFTFEVRAKDRNGELKTTGGDDWQVTIKGPKDAEIEVETKDHGDGRYSATYHLEADSEGTAVFTVTAKLDGKHVASSPFKHELSEKPKLGQRIRNFFHM